MDPWRALGRDQQRQCEHHISCIVTTVCIAITIVIINTMIKHRARAKFVQGESTQEQSVPSALSHPLVDTTEDKVSQQPKGGAGNKADVSFVGMMLVIASMFFFFVQSLHASNHSAENHRKAFLRQAHEAKTSSRRRSLNFFALLRPTEEQTNGHHLIQTPPTIQNSDNISGAHKADVGEDDVPMHPNTNPEEPQTDRAETPRERSLTMAHFVNADHLENEPNSAPLEKLQKKPNETSGTGDDGLPKPDEQTGVCWYDGHCRVREICAPTGQKGVGKCIDWSFSMQDAALENAAQACADACVTELRQDEHFHQDSWANIESINAFTIDAYPKGCRVVFRREPEGNHFDHLKKMDRNFKQTWKEQIHPSVKQWVETRFRHVKRVDPISGPPDDGDDRWVALCTNPCQKDADCGSGAVDSAFQCKEGSCQRNPVYWEPSSFKNHPVTLVTAATGSYFSGLSNLAASARFWAPTYKMVVYNLGGLSDEMKSQIRSWSNVISLEWPDGVPDIYPKHVKRGKVYAWKPILVNETLHKYGSIFYMDAGSTLSGPIDPVETILEREGIFLVKGQDANMHLSHSDSYKWFGYDKGNFKTGPHYSGNTQAFLYPSRYVDSVVMANAKCALDAKCIMPYGSNLNNHRYDQTTISILAYQPKIRLRHYVEYVAASQRQLNPDLTQPNTRFVWTARQSCSFYRQRETGGNSPPLRRRITTKKKDYAEHIVA